MSNDHYDVGGISVADFLRAKLTKAEYRGACKWNVIKYLARAEHKHRLEPWVDIAKAKEYMDWLADSYEELSGERGAPADQEGPPLGSDDAAAYEFGLRSDPGSVTALTEKALGP